MNKIKIIALKVLLLIVIFAECNSILQANVYPTKYVMIFPGATGFLFYLSQLTSFAALANCILIWLWKKWAIWANVIIGVWSIILVQIVEGSHVNQFIILLATIGILVLSLLVLDRFHSKANDKTFENE
jgi:hypothetical protein